nr:carbon starvation protein A [Phaeovibrio sulfidiphilus]
MAVLFIGAVVFFLASYRYYGRFLARTLGIDDRRKTPSETQYDGVDYVPTHPAILLGHHFSSIAGAGPIIGPITAAAWFGWAPAYLWCLVGSAFMGGPHDTGSLVASIRHQGHSIGTVVRKWIGERGQILFQTFSILTLILIVAVFLQLAADTMAKSSLVAFSATVFMVAALVFGLAVYRLGLSFVVSTVVLVPVVFGSCYLGYAYPAITEPFTFSLDTWKLILIGYILAASLLPVWLLLQPRDYLSSFFLYFAVGIGTVGMLAGSFMGVETTLPAFMDPVSEAPDGSKRYLWPMLFVVVACGAISGFHSMVGSGTSSKQLRRESDALVIGYGSMLLEGMVAVIAIGTVMIAGDVLSRGPIATFSEGFGRFAGLMGMSPVLGAAMGALAINVFILTTLDTATRLTRYQIQEFSGHRISKYSATLIAVGAAMLLLMSKSGDTPVWEIIWPVFGAANQLVAALALLGVGVWAKKALKVDNTFLMVPMGFMLVTTVTALGFLIRQELVSDTPNWALFGVSLTLVILAVLMVYESLRALGTGAAAAGEAPPR